MNIPLPRLLLLQLRVFDHRDVVRDLHADVITPEEYANYVELPGIIGGGPSKNLCKFSRDYICWPSNTFPKLTHLCLHEQLTTLSLDEFFDMPEESRVAMFRGFTPRTSGTGDPTPNVDSLNAALPYPVYAKSASSSSIRTL